MSGRPVTDVDRDQVRALHAQGKTRNEIARALGRSGRTVSRIADQLGLEFDRTRTREATAARVDDARARRTALALALLGDAERLRRALWEPCTAYNFGGKDNTFEQASLPEPSFRDKREIMTAVNLAAERAMRLDEYDRDQGAEDDKSMLVDLADQLGRAWRAGQPA